ncbi:glycosyltransferase [uncultured Microbulbifer sp.]|uniref:glycosyltransferase n=1 Tax=uncultured Microbulbifer sp. TaxID=348147 RepID=UPI0025F8FCE3|nr:glycosyltransferase [uncultured Microbulbifer sp.]
MSEHKSPETPPRRHRICHLFSSQEIGGLEKHVQEQCRWQLANTDAEVFVIAHPRYRHMFDEGVQFLAVNTDRGRRNPILSAILVYLMRRHAFDLVHAHGGKPAQIMQRIQGLIPAEVIITRHNTGNPKDKVSKHFRNRIAVSKRAVKNSQLQWEIIPNGTEIPETGDSYRGLLDENRPAVLSVARMVPAKGIDILINAWARAEVGDAVLYLLGDGPLHDKVEAQVQSLGVEDSVRFVGFQRAVADWFPVADMMVIASRHEGGPYTVAEALLADCPVLSTNVGYVSENIPAQYVVPIEDEKALAVLITAALGDPGKLRDSYAPYFARARARLTLDAMARDTWRVYLKALEG